MFSLHQLVDAWNDFFHAPAPYTTLGVVRIVWGFLLLLNGLLLIPQARRYFGPDGILATAGYQQVFGNSLFSLFQLLPKTHFSVYGLLAVHLISCALLMIGWYTTLSAIVCWATLVSLHHRNPCVLHSGDSVLRLLTFLLMFAPAGAAYSVDEWQRQQQARLGLESRADQGTAPNSARAVSGEPTPPARTGSPWVLRLMQIQICVIYLRTVYWKLLGKRWWDGTAAYYPVQIDSYTRLRLPEFCLNRYWIGLATYGTLLVEVALGTLIWVEELRYPILLLGVALHLVLEMFINTQLFGATMIASLLLFIPPEDMEWFLHRFTAN